MAIPRAATAPALLAVALLAPAAALAADGELDPRFDGNGSAFVNFDLGAGNTDWVGGLAVQRDGKVVVVGSASDDDGEVTKLAVARIDPDGTLDTGFGTGGVFVLDFSNLGLALTRAAGRAVAVNRWDRVLIAGAVRDGAVDRPLFVQLTGNGTLDPTFFGDGILVGNVAGEANDFAMSDSTIVNWAVGTTASGNLWTWRQVIGEAPAEREWTVQGSTELEGTAVIVQPDGRPVLLGSHLPNGTADVDLFVVRLLADGTQADATFASSGMFRYGFDVAPPDYDEDLPLDLALDPAGRIVVLAETFVGPGSFSDASDLGFLRLTKQGALDGSFGTGGARRVGFYGGGARDAWGEGAVAVQGDRKIVAGTTPGTTPFDVRAGALRLLPSGALDTGFGGAGSGRIVFELDPAGGSGDGRCGIRALELEGGRFFGAGASEWLDPDYDFGLARLTSSLIFSDGFEIGSVHFWWQP